MNKALVILTQLLVLAAGVSLSLAVDWIPFNGTGLVVHSQYVPWAIVTTVLAAAFGLVLWRRSRAKNQGR